MHSQRIGLTGGKCRRQKTGGDTAKQSSDVSESRCLPFYQKGVQARWRVDSFSLADGFDQEHCNMPTMEFECALDRGPR